MRTGCEGQGDKYYGQKPLYSVTTRQVAIPVWVHKSVRPEDGSAITPAQLMASNADLMVSIKELRKSTRPWDDGVLLCRMILFTSASAAIFYANQVP